MSLAESFLNTAKDMLMMSENIKRLESKVDRIADDVHGLDRRLMKIELMIDLSKRPAGKRAPRELP
jgi:uncharacterized protein Yka (UPF0111/DUF47 family)